MNEETMNKLKKESAYLAITFAAFLMIFKIAFYNESAFNAVKITASIFWMFVLPGFLIMFYWHENLEFIERLVIGTALGLGIMGSASYYLGLIGLNINHQTILLPLSFIVIGLLTSIRSKNFNNQQK
ncbi:MAG: hypothetical protein AABX00_04735 [Nanoarchaeota archaeon]